MAPKSQVISEPPGPSRLPVSEPNGANHAGDPRPVRDGAAAWRALVEMLPHGVFRKDVDGRYLYANGAFCSAVGKRPDEILGQTDAALFPAPMAELITADDRRALEVGGIVETACGSPSRPSARIKVRRAPLGPAESPLGVQGFLWETGEDPQALRDEILLLETIWENIPESLYVKDRESRFTRVNGFTVRKFGAESHEAMMGKTDFDIFTTEHARQAFRDEQEIVRTGRPLVDLEEKETLPGGEVRWVSTTKMPLRDAQGRIIGTFGISRDITERKLAEEKLAYRAFYDLLTDLPNRALFLNRLEHLFRRAQRPGRRMPMFGIILVDLDRFQGVNDSLGHEAGDELLVEIARRIETCVRPGDTLARLGGDEFAILLEEIREEADATQVADRIQSELAAAVAVRGHDLFASASLGIALSSTGYKRPDEMLRDADTALARAKRGGRGRHQVFDSDMHSRAVERLQLETDMRHAIGREEWVVFYQPIVDLAAGRIVAFEALLRWRHPQRGLVMPDLFIPIAEETGLIAPLGLWALRQSCVQLQSWRSRFGLDALTMGVNLSTRQLLDPQLVEQVLEVLRDTSLVPEALTLEITETALMPDLAAGAAVIRRLHERGVNLHIDDFGTGYSSLAYLQTFPVQTLKVDRSFIKQMGERHGPSEIVKAIIGLAQTLGMTVTAEGVESTAQVEALRALGCDKAQGYYFGCPVPAEEAEALLVRGLPPF